MADREKERGRGRGKSLGAQLDEAQQEATNLLANLQNAIHEIQGAAPQGLIQLTQAASANLQIAIQGANQATQELTLATQQAAQATQEATQATQEATQATAALQAVQEVLSSSVRNVINQLAVSGQSILAILGPAAVGRYQLHHDLMISIDLLLLSLRCSCWSSQCHRSCCCWKRGDPGRRGRRGRGRGRRGRRGRRSSSSCDHNRSSSCSSFFKGCFSSCFKGSCSQGCCSSCFKSKGV